MTSGSDDRGDGRTPRQRAVWRGGVLTVCELIALELREHFPPPQPWETPDELQPIAERLLEAMRLNRLSANEEGS